jgi:hypothetical protein
VGTTFDKTIAIAKKTIPAMPFFISNAAMNYSPAGFPPLPKFYNIIILIGF